jgi:hypothetical protein
MVSSGMLRRVALVRTDVSEELSASFIRVTRIGELGTLPVTSNLTWYFFAACVRCQLQQKFLNLTLWPLVRKRTIPTERPPLVDEI